MFPCPRFFWFCLLSSFLQIGVACNRYLATEATPTTLLEIQKSIVDKPLRNYTLQDKQALFAHLTARLITKAEELGYEVTLGEAWRSQEVASFQTKFNEEKGIGIARSLHTKRLAIDLNLFKNGIFLTATDAYRPLGEWWEKQSVDGIACRWGGRFKRADGNHFSVEHEGIR